MKGRGKGSKFERDICRLLSRWWTNDPDTDVLFWRTSQSGGRVTHRVRQGKRAAQAQAGDIAALDDRGAPLTQTITFELKRGYPTATLHAMLDAGPNAAIQEYQSWVNQAQAASQAAQTPFWAIIHSRNQRATTITVPQELIDQLGCESAISLPTMKFRVLTQTLFSCRLTSFLSSIDPFEISCLHRQKNP